MRRALALAERGWGQTAPNPMVGAVVVRDGVVVGEGFHERFGAAHAERAALAAAGEAACGATLYVTLEPCAHHGKTPPCTAAVIASGVTRVVAAVADPTDAGGGADVLRRAGIDVVVGAEADAARELNAPFFHAVGSDRPWTTVKLATTRDGAIAPACSDTDAPRWFTGAEARVAVHKMRAGSDAIAVGVGTVIADDPRLTVRDWRAPRCAPLRVVFDRHARTPPDARLIRTARDTPTLVVTDPAPGPRADALREAGAEILEAASLHEALRRLRARGVRSLLVEGGAAIAAAFLDGGLADRLVMLEAPISIGPGGLHAFARVRDKAALGRRLREIEQRRLGGDTMTVYELAR